GWSRSSASRSCIGNGNTKVLKLFRSADRPGRERWRCPTASQAQEGALRPATGHKSSLDGSFWDMACSLSAVAPWQHSMLAGREHGRTRAATLAAIPAGESPANRGVQTLL